MGGSLHLMPIISKTFCSPFQTTLMIRKRPHVASGGGFVVTDCNQKAIFTVEGCGILGTEGEMVIRDGDGGSFLFVRKKGGIIQALSTRNRWNGYLMDDHGASDLVFSLREPKPCLSMKNTVRISIETKGHGKDWDFEVSGSFLSRSCTINDRRGNFVAEVRVEELIGSQDFYRVVVQPGYDQAFVVGVIAVLDNIHGESTRC